MEDARRAYEVREKREIYIVENYSKCVHLIPLQCAILCKEQVLNSVFGQASSAQ